MRDATEGAIKIPRVDIIVEVEVVDESIGVSAVEGEVKVEVTDVSVVKVGVDSEIVGTGKGAIKIESAGVVEVVIDRMGLVEAKVKVKGSNDSRFVGSSYRARFLLNPGKKLL